MVPNVNSFERGLFLVYLSSAGASILISVHTLQFPRREAGDESGLGWRWSEFDSLKGGWVLLEKISLEFVSVAGTIQEWKTPQDSWCKMWNCICLYIYYNYIFINYLWLCNALPWPESVVCSWHSVLDEGTNCLFAFCLFYTLSRILRLSVWWRW